MALNLASALENLAPTIGAAFGGPLVGGGIEAAERAFGLTPAAGDSIATRQDALTSAMQAATPEQLISLRQEDDKFKLALQQAGFAHSEATQALAQKVQLAQVADKDSARQMASKTGDFWTPRLLTFAVVIIWGLINGALVWMTAQHIVLDPQMGQLLSRVLGTLDAALTLCLAYYFGSSSGADRKTELMAQNTPGKT